VNVRLLALALVATISTALAADLPRTPAPPDAEVYFISPQDGEVVSTFLVVKFGLKGMGVAPAGVEVEHTGHHHLLVDVPDPDFSKPVPSDTQHIHFGKGQTETFVELPPGQHTLQLVMADHVHMPHEPPVVSAKITVTVE
jgi:hypothetical protein